MATGYLELWDISSDERIAFWSINKIKPGEYSRSHRGVHSDRLFQGVSSIKNQVRVRFAWHKSADQAICSQLSGCMRAVMQISVGSSKFVSVPKTVSDCYTNECWNNLAWLVYTYNHKCVSARIRTCTLINTHMRAYAHTFVLCFMQLAYVEFKTLVSWQSVFVPLMHAQLSEAGGRQTVG